MPKMYCARQAQTAILPYVIHCNPGHDHNKKKLLLVLRGSRSQAKFSLLPHTHLPKVRSLPPVCHLETDECAYIRLCEFYVPAYTVLRESR